MTCRLAETLASLTFIRDIGSLHIEAHSLISHAQWQMPLYMKTWMSFIHRAGYSAGALRTSMRLDD